MATTSLYHKYHASRQDERLGLFQSVCVEFGVTRGLYPGCFVHITPSFVIPQMFYVDSDRNARRFFADGTALDLVGQNRVYDRSPFLEFHFQDYRSSMPIDDECVDLLIPKSQSVPQEPSELADHIRGLGKGIGYTRMAITCSRRSDGSAVLFTRGRTR